MKGLKSLLVLFIFAFSQLSFADVRDEKIKSLEQQINELKEVTNKLQADLESIKEEKGLPEEETPSVAGTESKGLRFFQLGSPFDPERKYALTPLYRWTEMDVRLANAQKMKLYMGLDTVGRYQVISQHDVNITPAATKDIPTPTSVHKSNIEPGFQTPWGNLSLLADYDSRVAVYFDLYLASRQHPSQVYGHEGYIVLRSLPESLAGTPILEKLFDYVDVRAGAFDIDFGDQQYRRTNNASAQRNPLIGNYVVDPSSDEIGVEIFSDPGKFFWLVGLTSGTTTGDFKAGRGLGAVHAKVGVNLLDSLRFSTSVYRVDHSGNPAKPDGTASTLFAGNRSGESYGGIFDDSDGAGQVLAGKGQDVTAIQGDVTWNWSRLALYGHYGWVRDSDPNGSLAGSLEESWAYYAAEAVFNLTDRLYLAARYSGAAADKLKDMSSDGLVHRVQAGGGFWIMEDLLFKLEYVNEWFDGFNRRSGQVAGVDAWTDPSFDGVISEVSYSF